ALRTHLHSFPTRRSSDLKEEGKNTYQFYTAALKSNTVEKLALETHLRHAVERSELDVYYQAKVSIQTGEIRGVEALLRWHSPVRSEEHTSELQSRENLVC